MKYLFGFNDYYPVGGIGDFVRTFTNEELAEAGGLCKWIEEHSEFENYQLVTFHDHGFRVLDAYSLNSYTFVWQRSSLEEIERIGIRDKFWTPSYTPEKVKQLREHYLRIEKENAKLKEDQIDWSRFQVWTGEVKISKVYKHEDNENPSPSEDPKGS
jgi:hypothetical protein